MTVRSRIEYGDATVGNQNRSPYTLFAVEVRDVAQSIELGVAAQQPTIGDTIEIRMLGTSGYPGPMPRLEDGRTYLTFLRPTGLAEAGADQYYLVGGTAGLYQTDRPLDAAAPVDVSSLPFDKDGIANEGDSLPARVTMNDIEASLTLSPES